MKIALLSGAYKNAGDFLIEKRCRALLQYCYPDAEISVLKRNDSFDGRIDELNSYDLIVFGGGPGFRKNVYPNKIPFVSNIEEVKVPCCILGWGWKEQSINTALIYKKNYFGSKMYQFIKSMDDKKAVSCRDWYTKRMLDNQGFKNVRMTGCPAWYDVDVVNNLTYKGCSLAGKENPYIIVSDAAFPKNIKQTEKLISILRGIYPKARIKLLLHRGITSQNSYLSGKDIMEKYCYECEDISGSVDGFSQYDECDLHIGFRVHAHIYNLSHGNTTILINEDARGFGVNDALGLPNIVIDKYLDKTVEDAIEYVVTTKGNCYNNAASNMKKYFGEMTEYIKGLL